MSILQNVNWSDVREHYLLRESISQDLIAYHNEGRIRKFCELMLGISSRHSNYSANEHALGPMILTNNPNAHERVFNLAGNFRAAKSGHEAPALIKAANISYLKIGVGSEASCMMNSKIFWVSNTRTIWTHLLFKHNEDFRKANLELSLYRGGDQNSEMAYRIWSDIHRKMDVELTKIATKSDEFCLTAGEISERTSYLWADAIANYIYENLR